MSSPNNLNNIHRAVHLAKPVIPELDQDIKDALPGFENIDKYQRNTVISDTPGSVLSVDSDLNINRPGFTINEGSQFQQGTETDFLLRLKPETIPAGTEVPSGVYIEPSSSLQIAEEIILPPTYSPNQKIKVEHNGSTFEVQPGYTLPVGTIFKNSFVNNIPGLKLTADIENPPYLRAGQTLEGPFSCNTAIEAEVAGTPTVIPARQHIPQGTSVTLTKDLVLHTGDILGGKLPFTVRTDSFQATRAARPTATIPAGTKLVGKTQVETSDLSTLPSIIGLNAMPTADITTQNPITLFQNLFLSGQSDSVYDSDTYTQVESFFQSLDNETGTISETLRLTKLKAILHLLRKLKVFNDNSSTKFTDTNLLAFIAHTRDTVQQLEDELGDSTNAEYNEDFGGYVEREQGLSKYIFHREKSNDEIKNEIQATTNRVRQSVSSSINNSLQISDDIDANQAEYEKFKNEYAKEALSKGMDTILDRLDTIFEQSVTAREEYLNKSISGRLQKLGSHFKKMSFLNKTLIFAGIGAAGVGVGALTGFSGAAIVTPLIMKSYAAYGFGGFAKDMNKKFRGFLNQKSGKLGKANAVEMDYFLRSLPDTKEGEHKAEYDKNVASNRLQQRRAMNQKVKTSLQSAKYKSRIQALKNGVEAADTPEESRAALVTLRLAYTEIITEILEEFYTEQIEAMIKARRFRTVARGLEYGAGAGFVYGLPLIPKAIMGLAEYVQGIEPPTELLENLSLKDRWAVTKDTTSNIFSIFTGNEAVANDLPTGTETPSTGGPFNKDGSYTGPSSDPSEAISKANSTVNESISSAASEAASQTTSSTLTDQSIRVPSDELATKLFNGDKDPGLTSMLNMIGGKDIPYSQAKPIIEQIVADNKISNPNLIFDGQKLDFSSKTLSMLQEATKSSPEAILENLKKFK